jgi:phosphatidylinositol alpha-1,6-mannosyltransferase
MATSDRSFDFEVKSLLISQYFPPSVGGIPAFMGSVAGALGPSRVCCLTDTPAGGPTTDPIERLRVYRRPAVFAGSMPTQALALAGTVAEIMVRDRPRAVQLGTVEEGYLGLGLQRWLGFPFVVYAHGNEILAAMGSAWDKPRRALQQAARVLANSRFTASLVEQAGVRRESVEIVHPGCDVELYRPVGSDPDFRRQILGDRSGDKVIVTVGGLTPRKGYDMVIRALPRVLQRCPNVTYLIATSHPRGYDRQLDELARGLGVRDRVVFAYHVPTVDLPRIYAMSDIFAMPSRAQLDACDVEGFGIVYLEANACGKAVVAGRSGGVADAVVDGVTGLLVDPLASEAVAEGLGRLLSDPELAVRLGRQGRERVVAQFTWDRVASQVQQILDTVTRGDGSTRVDSPGLGVRDTGSRPRNVETI